MGTAILLLRPLHLGGSDSKPSFSSLTCLDKKLQYRHFLDGYALEEIQISVAETSSSQVDPVQLVPTHHPSIPARKSYYFLDGYALEEIQISVAETRISILPEQPLFVTGGWRHPAPPTCCAMQEKPSQNLHKSPTPMVPVCSEKDTCGTAPLQHQLHSNRVKICNLVNKHQKIALTNITNRRQYSKLSTK